METGAGRGAREVENRRFPPRVLPGHQQEVPHQSVADEGRPITATRADVTATRADVTATEEGIAFGGHFLVGAARSVTGTGRAANEDSWHLDNRLAIVADGMGGRPGGATASALAVDVVQRLLGTPGWGGDPPDRLLHAVRSAHRRVTAAARTSGHPGMGTTLTGIELAADGRTSVVHLGDSRAFLHRRGALVPLTVDHSVAVPHARGTRRALTRCVGGAGDTAVPDILGFQAELGDRLLIYSDGLRHSLSDAAVAEILAHHDAPDAAADTLVGGTRGPAGSDDVTVVVADVWTSTAWAECAGPTRHSEESRGER